MEQKNININAYISPHPLDDESDFEVEWLSWLPGFNHEDDADGLGIIYNDDNIELYKSIEDKTTELIKAAYNNLAPLFENHLIKALNVWIDLVGLFSNGSSSAGYHYNNSRPEKGTYQFNADQYLIQRYVSKNFGELPKSHRIHYIWEHEILHMLDHRFIEKSSVYQLSDEMNELYKYFLLKFRVEGFPELYYLLHGNHDDISSIEQAKVAFLNLHTEVKNQMEETGLFPKEIYKKYDYYELGPWLLMDFLRSFEGGYHYERIENALQIVLKKEAVPKEEIFEIIKIVKRIDIKDFLYYCTTIQTSSN